MAQPPYVELGSRRNPIRIPILYEDRSVIALDKPAGWMLVPVSWQRTQRNLQAALTSSIAAGYFWARSRNLKFLRHIHRLDADTTGILLCAKSLGALDTFSEMFESRKMEKTYLAVVRGEPRESAWTCAARLGPEPRQIGRIRVDPENGKDAETAFRVLQTHAGMSLIEARPLTGRTHQIRVHLLESGHPVLGDDLYGPPPAREGSGRGDQTFPLALRAVALRYVDPFRRRPVSVVAPVDRFLRAFGMKPDAWALPEART